MIKQLKGFLSAWGINVPDGLDPFKEEEAVFKALFKLLSDQKAAIADLESKLAAANQKLAKAGQGPVTVENSTLANSGDVESARLALDGETRRLEASGMNYTAAFTAARALRPDLAQRALARPVLANILESIPPFPGKKPEIVEALGLTADADAKLFEIAWTATHGKIAPADSLAIFRQVRAWLAGFKGISSDAAEDQIEQDFPVLYQRAQAAQTAALENTIVAHPGAKLMLGLPADASLDEFAAALKGNGGVVSPLNARAVWDAVVRWLASKRGMGVGGVEKEAVQRYPQLAAALGISRV